MKKAIILSLLVSVTWSSLSSAGVYTDDLTKCIVAKTSPDDRITLVKWVFIAMSRHPAVASMTKVTESDTATANEAAAALFTNLMTVNCADATRSAMKYEGVAAIQSAFSVLGQVAMGDLMSDPGVGSVLAQLEKYIDPSKFESLK